MNENKNKFYNALRSIYFMKVYPKPNTQHATNR